MPAACLPSSASTCNGHIPFLLGELDAGGYALLPQGVQNLVADTVDPQGGALDRGAAELARVAAEPALGDMPVLGTGEGHALTLQVDHGLAARIRRASLAASWSTSQSPPLMVSS